MRPVVQLHGEDDPRRPRFAEHEVEMLLGNRSPVSAPPVGLRAGEHVGDADLAHDLESVAHGLQERAIERGLALGEKRPAALVWK